MDMLSNLLDTKDKMTKMTILLASSALLVLIIKNNEKILTKRLTNSLLLLVVLGSLFLGYLINEQDDIDEITAEGFSNNDNESISDLSLTNTTITENFQDPEQVTEDPGTPSIPEVVDVPEPSVNEDNESVQPDNVSEAGSNNTVESNVAPSEPDSDNFAEFGNDNSVPKLPESCFPKDILNSSELLPKDSDNAWAENVPAGQGELSEQNFLNAGYHVGVNTVGQSLRNANRQLRSDPPCPQVKVSPWLQSTIEPDLNRRPLEIS